MSSNGKDTCGVLYIASGADHIRHAIGSAQSVRRTNPDISIHLFADFEKQNFQLDERINPFTSWENIPDPHRRSKVDYMAQTPFDRTLYLDTDTRVVCDLTDVFNVLDRFDVALAHAHKREILKKQLQIKFPVPRAFPQFNSGVFFYRRNEKTMQAFQQWRDWFYESNLLTDQNSLREVLWMSDLRIATLPPEYNVRFLKYFLVWDKEEARPKILHLPYYKDGLKTYIRRFSRRIVRRLKG